MAGALHIFNDIWDPTSHSLRLTGSTDTIFYPASQLSTIAGTPGTANTNGVFRVTLPDAATTTVGFTFIPPSFWNTFSVSTIWIGESGTGNVRWTVDVKKIDILVDNISEAVFATLSGTAGSGTSGIPQFLVDTPTNINSTPGVAGSVYPIQISRIGADGADTLAAAAGIIVVGLSRKS